MPQLLLGDVPELNAARLGPERWAIRHDDAVLSWGELADRTLRRAHALAAAGVREGDFVVLALPNGNAFYELTFALWKLGATPAVVSSRLPHAELLPIIESLQARLVVAHDPALIAATGAQPDDFGRDHPDTTPLPSRVAKHWKAMTSGGSTGRAKVIIDHHTSLFDVGVPSLRLPTDGVVLNPGPLYHNFPFALTHSALVHGNSIVGMTKFDAAKLLELIERHRVEWVNLVPTMMSRIARLSEEVRQAHDLSSLKAVWHTAAPIPSWLKQLWIDWIGPERIWLGDYGWVDTDGYLYIADRRTDLILCGGSNIYPAEVEAVLMEHPRVETAIVIGLPDDDLGAVPHAVIRGEQGVEPPTEAELRVFVTERLVRYKTPRSYEFTAAPLRDEAGKVRRSQLRAERLEQLESKPEKRA